MGWLYLSWPFLALSLSLSLSLPLYLSSLAHPTNNQLICFHLTIPYCIEIDTSHPSIHPINRIRSETCCSLCPPWLWCSLSLLLPRLTPNDEKATFWAASTTAGVEKATISELPLPPVLLSSVNVILLPLRCHKVCSSDKDFRMHT